MASHEGKQAQPFAGIFDEDEAEKSFLLSKPTCLLILGKPGSGKKTLARKLAQMWKFIFIEASEVIQMNIREETEYGLKCQELLFKGQSVSEELVTEMILKRIESPEVAHFGYVLSGFPSLSEEYMTVSQQIEKIKNLKLRPDFLINIKCSDYDLCQRISGQRQHPDSGQVYQRNQWDPDVISKHKKEKNQQEKESEEDEEQEDEKQEEEEAAEAPLRTSEFLHQLVQRPEHILENAEASIGTYKDIMLRPLEDWMAEQDCQYLIELDGNQQPDDLFMSVVARLQSLGVQNAAPITRLQSEEEEGQLEGLENDELFRVLSSYKRIAPRYRWRRSRWGQACPVALKEGDIVMGNPDLAVSFLGKMYVLSSPEALKTFMLNPRPYLLPPMPLPPCKVLVFGPPFSGRTTICNLIADKYKGKVLDMAELIQPCMEELREEKIEQVRRDAVEKAIAAVKNRLALDKQATDSGMSEITADLPEVQAVAEETVTAEHPEVQAMTEETITAEHPEVQAMTEETITAEHPEVQAMTEETITAEHPEVQAMTEETITAEHPEVQAMTEETITAEHPEVQAMVEETISGASVSEVTLSPERYAEVLERAIAELMKKNRDRYPGAPEKGGWVVDNYPLSADHWSALLDKGLLPDTVVCLKDTQRDGACLLARTYSANRDEINAEILNRLREEALKKKEEEEEVVRKEMQTSGENQSLQSSEEKEVEDSDKQLPLESDQTPQKEPSDSAGYEEESKPAEIALPELAEDDFPNLPEMETIKRKLDLFLHDWQTVESEIKQSSLVQVVGLEIAEQTPESLLNQIVLAMEKPFKYHGWELSAEDLQEEEDDLAAEGEDEEAEEQENEDDEDEEEEDEDKIKEKKRHMGDTKHFCPVSLKEDFVLCPGLSEHAAKYQEKLYYFSTSEHREQFLKNPEDYVAHSEPIQAPPLRVCLIGPHGAGKSTCARQVAEKLGIFHIQFEEYLQELILPKTKRKVGPSSEEEPEDDDDKIPNLAEELEDFTQSITETETEKRKQEVELTDEEEAIKANLVDNEELPAEVLDNIVPDWWRKEPFRSTGFILDGFPRTSAEAQYLSERGLCPDVVVCIEVEDSDVLDRLFPPRLKKWQDRQHKKMEKKKKLKDLKAKIRALANKEPYEATEEEDENENEDIEAILDEEFLEEEEEEEEEDEEQESDAVERIQNEITEKFESEIESLQGVKEELERMSIPGVEVSGGRKPRVVFCQTYSRLNALLETRGSIFEKCYPISLPLAHKMLASSYKFPSAFGQWDPVKLSEGNVIRPQQSHEKAVLPLIHRQYIYFFSSKENQERFMRNPIKYIRQPRPKPAVPVKIAIVGPPKSGKTTVAKKFASVYGLLRLSVGDAVRLVLASQPESQLALGLKWHLHRGQTVPDELAIQALDVALMNHVCATTGVVIDGYPVTRRQVNLLESARIIPVKIFELEMDAKEVFRRALLDGESTDRPPYSKHDSLEILAVKNSCYKQHIDAIRTYYEKEHQNWCVIDASQSKWWIWNKVLQEVEMVVKEIQRYLERIKEGKAAGIADLCITPEELQLRLGEFGQYCPVSLAEKGELVDCSALSLQFAAEFRGHYYKMASQEELDKFLSQPEVYVPPLAPHPLPLPDMLPQKLTAAEVKALFPISAEMQGYCPVTYLDGKLRYEALVPGTSEYAAKYQGKVYVFESEGKLLKFMRLPEKYCNLKLPHKLPPRKEPILLTALPLLGYLEQGVATSLIKALSEVGCLKPKFPFLSVKATALLFVACHLKAHNPRSSEPVRQIYQRQLAQFTEHCQLIPYLKAAMTGPYLEPSCRPLGLDSRLQTFFALKETGPSLV
ncbi:adenylate kinase 9-like isoform X3 [Melanerpes formicivorus]|uniref:adenylate kinase 9-like isoform X3 n=1 Tax=Melanerpes formicivorus TaxID=211600 RepID=UPI00358E09EA